MCPLRQHLAGVTARTSPRHLSSLISCLLGSAGSSAPGDPSVFLGTTDSSWLPACRLAWLFCLSVETVYLRWLYVNVPFPLCSATSFSDTVKWGLAGEDWWSGFQHRFESRSLQALWIQKAVLLYACMDLTLASPNQQSVWSHYYKTPYVAFRADRHPGFMGLLEVGVGSLCLGLIYCLSFHWQPSVYYPKKRCGGSLRAVSSLSALSGCTQRVLFVFSGSVVVTGNNIHTQPQWIRDVNFLHVHTV